MTIAEKIIKVRLDSGLSKEDFAKKLDISADTLEKYESGEIIPDDDLRVKISCEFSLPPDELYLDETEQQDLNAQTEPTIDQRLPYNPYAQQLPNLPYMTPTPVQKNKLFKSAALKTAVFPDLLVLPIFIIFSILSTIPHFIGNSSSFYSQTILSLQSIMTVIFTALFFYLVSKHQFNRTFTLLNKVSDTVFIFPLFMVSVYTFSNFVNGILNNLFLLFRINEKLTNFSFENYILTFALSAFGFISLIFSVLAVYFLITKLFKFADSADNDDQVKDFSKHTFILFVVLWALSFLTLITGIVINSLPAVNILNYLPSYIFNLIVCMIWFVLYKNPEKKSNKSLMSVIPYIIYLVPQILSVFKIIVKMIWQ